MAETPRAADLPEGTIIGYASLAVIKPVPGDNLTWPWASTHNRLYGDATIDVWLADGASVLRYGYGEQANP
jgi:hypothetical protein